MTPAEPAPPPPSSDPAEARTLATSRRLDAPPERVYEAFVAADRLARWWGPNGFRSTFHVFEPRPGGAWKFVMHGPDGKDYRNESAFEALVPGERVVIRHLNGHLFTLTVTLAPDGAGTRLAWRQVFDSARECDAVRAFAGPANEENLDRLEAELARGG